MSETITGEVGQITTGKETGKKYVCRFALREADGLFFVWDKKVPGLDLIEDGAELTVTHDGSEYKKVEKIEVPDQAAKETAGRVAPTLATDEAKKAAARADSKVEQAMKKVEAEDTEAWRIARSCATERVFGNGKIGAVLTDDEMIAHLEAADKIATFIATGQIPSKKKS